MRYRWDQHAETNGHFAIAVALLEVAAAIHRLGNADASTPMGAIEALGAHLGEKFETAGDKIAEAIAISKE